MNSHQFTGTDAEGNKVVGLGLTEKTYREMLEGKALVLNLGPLGVPNVKLILLAGKDGAAISRDLQQAINKETKVVLPANAVLRNDG